MSEFFELYFDAFIVTVPVTIYLIVLIIRGIKEFLDFVINRKSVEDLISQVDSISFEKLDNELELHTVKLQSEFPWTNEHFSASREKRKLEIQLKSQYYKRDKDRIKLKIRELENALGQYEREYWASEFGIQKSEYELAREMKLRKIFSPQ